MVMPARTVTRARLTMTEARMPYSYTLRTVIAATPQQIYAAWLDSLAHTDMTGGEANMSDEVGAAVSAWDGYITGRNLELVPGRRIVQSWRTSQFADEHEDSVVTITLEGTDDGTLLTLVHSNVPDSQRSYEERGWEENYFAPMKDYFAALAHEIGEEEPQPVAAKRKAKAKAKTREKRATKPKRARKPAPRKKQQRAKPKAKRFASAKAKRKGAARLAKKHKTARRTARKTARRR
jgi:uncharacterized protein YndB with AHSA1/START domain